ncbi:MAG: class I SAM-dependent methyltransferase [Promethearchaeota archaeon]
MAYKDYIKWIKKFKKEYSKSDIEFEILIQRINELYFNVISNKYQKLHPSISEFETKRWKNIGKVLKNIKIPLKILDLGTGTGFVPKIISNYLKSHDIFFCCDISDEILKLAKKQICSHSFQCKFEFIKIESKHPLNLLFNSNYFNIITLNSVLHHINDFNSFLTEIDRILIRKGWVIIAHEPNKRFYNNKLLWCNFLLINYINRLINSFYLRLFKKRKKKISFTNNYKKKKATVSKKINKILIEENLLKKPLSYTQILLLVDINSMLGFDPIKLMKNYRIIFFETYNHLFWFSNKNIIYKIYNAILEKIFPLDGATFTIGLQKL